MQELETALHAKGSSLKPALRLGVVQTAYANGASTAFLRKILGEDRVLIAKTGVKHVHHTAESNLDVGVYFEANGHGTILCGETFDQAMAHAKSILGRNPSCLALRRLCLLPSLVNQAVGDALSDMLLVDAILKLQGWSMDDWDAVYQDLPSRQCKVKVQDRSVITTNENETKCLHPAKLQNALDGAMKMTTQGRCFVRPSGTENVVRVYAEASSSQEADALATKAAQLIHDFCGGTDTPPSFPSSKI
jgi:phosphoacetylglucosamine mutase